MTRLLKGKEVADAIETSCIGKTAILNEKGIVPAMALFRVGSKKDDLSYEKGIIKRFERIGIRLLHYVFSEDIDEKTFYEALYEANNDESIHGILVFRPLPKRFDDEKLRNFIWASKDMDGCNDLSLSGVFSGKDLGYAPCTAEAVIEMLDYYQINPEGKNVVVIGRSLVIGKPVSMLLLNRNATVTICHRKSPDIEKTASKADILVCATGKPEIIKRPYLNPEQTIIDVGIGWSEEKQKICGDVLFEDADGYVRDLSPVPGGIGSITTAILAKHVIEAAEKTLLEL